MDFELLQFIHDGLFVHMLVRDTIDNEYFFYPNLDMKTDWNSGVVIPNPMRILFQK